MIGGDEVVCGRTISEQDVDSTPSGDKFLFGVDVRRDIVIARQKDTPSSRGFVVVERFATGNNIEFGRIG